MEGPFVMSVRKAARLLDLSETAVHSARSRTRLLHGEHPCIGALSCF